MRGYLSFILVFSSLILILSLLGLNISSQPRGYEKALQAERAYGLSMDVKSSILESLRQGAQAAFGRYDSSHDLPSCSSCPDHGCLSAPGLPNSCDFVRCSMCFREPEARSEAEKGASEAIRSLQQHGFDDAFSVSFKEPGISVSTRMDPSSRNGIALDSLTLKDDVRISLGSDALQLFANSTLRGGTVMPFEGPAID